MLRTFATAAEPAKETSAPRFPHSADLAAGIPALVYSRILVRYGS
jgi:hypothetical protein